MTDPSASGPMPPAHRRLRWGAVAGLVVFGYAMWAAVDLVVAAASRRAFQRLHALYGSVGARLVLCVVLVAVLFHSLDGLRRMVEELRPTLVRHDAHLRAVASFVTAALAVPAAAVVLWPSVQEWFG